MSVKSRQLSHRTALVWDERYLWHHPGGGAGPLAHGAALVEPGDFGEEGPHPRRRLRSLIEVSGLIDALVPVDARPASRAELERAHTSEYVSRVRALSATGGGDAGDGTPFGHNGYDIAALAAGGCIAAVDAVMDGRVDNAYALVKPPGHHASCASGAGHCIFNNVAVAARHAMATRGVERVTIVDWDVHWGNGTQEIFWVDPAVQFISLHQADWYPRGGGHAHDVGDGPGVGLNINVPLPPGSGIGAYRAAFERIIGPALTAHRPQLILVSSGFDSGANDPTGRMLLTSQNYHELTQFLLGAAQHHCDGRLVVCHEGGYSPTYTPFCGVAVIEALAGIADPDRIEDPFLPRYTGVGYEQLQNHQSAAITEVLAHHPSLVQIAFA